MHSSPSVSVPHPGWPQTLNMAIPGPYGSERRPGTSGSGPDGQTCGNSEISAAAPGGEDVGPGAAGGGDPGPRREAPGRPDLGEHCRDAGETVGRGEGARADRDLVAGGAAVGDAAHEDTAAAANGARLDRQRDGDRRGAVADVGAAGARRREPAVAEPRRARGAENIRTPAGVLHAAPGDTRGGRPEHLVAGELKRLVGCRERGAVPRV